MSYFNDCVTLEDVKKKYRDLAKKFHPDTGGSAEKMKELNEAYNRACEEIKNGHKDPFNKEDIDNLRRKYEESYYYFTNRHSRNPNGSFSQTKFNRFSMPNDENERIKQLEDAIFALKTALQIKTDYVDLLTRKIQMQNDQISSLEESNQNLRKALEEEN